MVMVIRKSFRLLTAWVLAAVLLAALGSDALAATGSKVWGRRSAGLGATTSSPSGQSRKPGIRPMAGEPDGPNQSPLPSTSKDGGTPAGSQLPAWQQLLQGLLPLVGGQRLP
jgi:hypothetical protein